MWPDAWVVATSVAAGLVLVWAMLVAVLWAAKPDEMGVRDALRLLPDVLRLLKRLASDPAAPRGVRIRLALLLAYLALPIDLIPDFIPVLGYADDAVVVVIALRSVVRHAGSDTLARHWPGTPEGLAAVYRLCRLPE